MVVFQKEPGKFKVQILEGSVCTIHIYEGSNIYNVLDWFQ